MKPLRVLAGLVVVGTLTAQGSPRVPIPKTVGPQMGDKGAARNAILFVGDGMGIATLTATRMHAVGAAEQLTIDQLPHTALSRIYAGDYLTPDSSSTMSSMVSGQKGNMGVVAMDSATERADLNNDGDGQPVTTLIELAKSTGKLVGIVTTDDVTGATPASCYAHINDRSRQLEIILQALPADATYNPALRSGLDLLAGGGRGTCVPDSMLDEEGEPGLRSDGRDLRTEFQNAGYGYVWKESQWNVQPRPQLPLIALFDRGVMEYEHERHLDVAGNPSLPEMVLGAVEMLDRHPEGFLLIVEGARIDHAHHANNAYRAITETEQLDRAVDVAINSVDLAETLVMVTADHGHTFYIAGYPMRPRADIPYPVRTAPTDNLYGPPGNLFSVSFFIDIGSGIVRRSIDSTGVPYPVLGYGNGPGYRPNGRVDPFLDRTPGFGGALVFSPTDPNYLQEAAVPMGAGTHSGGDVSIHAIGYGSSAVKGVLDNTAVFEIIRATLGI